MEWPADLPDLLADLAEVLGPAANEPEAIARAVEVLNHLADCGWMVNRIADLDRARALAATPRPEMTNAIAGPPSRRGVFPK